MDKLTELVNYIIKNTFLNNYIIHNPYIEYTIIDSIEELYSCINITSSLGFLIKEDRSNKFITDITIRPNSILIPYGINSFILDIDDDYNIKIIDVMIDKREIIIYNNEYTNYKLDFKQSIIYEKMKMVRNGDKKNEK